MVVTVDLYIGTEPKVYVLDLRNRQAQVQHDEEVLNANCDIQ